jgi:cation diffusion facilitator CzcD-associated flavoprotein CzcO
MKTPQVKTIAVIGAGLSGLVAAKTCKEYGFDVVVYEKEKELGGVWASCRRYPGVRTQNPRDTYAFSDFRMPKNFDEWPRGQDVQQYLATFANHFGVISLINFSHAVSEISYNENVWTIKGIADSGTFEKKIDFLIICNGTFSDPFIPAIPGLDEFSEAGGLVLHTSEFHELEKVRNKRVAVVGYSKSATDVVVEVSRVAAQTHMIAREVKWKLPRFTMGINNKYLLLNRMGEALIKPINLNSVERFIHAVGMPEKMFGFMQKQLAKRQQLHKNGLLPAMGIKDLVFGEISIETEGFFQAVSDGEINVKQTEIEKCCNGQIVLRSGEVIMVDAIIFGTGYNQSISFMPDRYLKMITDEKGNYILHRNILPPHIPNLAFVGYNTSLYTNMTSEFAALWICEYLKGNIEKPSDEEIVKESASWIKWKSGFRENGSCKGLNLGPLSIDHVDTLLRDMGEKLPLYSVIPDWFVIEPARYKPLKKRIMKRSGAVVTNA